MQESPDGEAAEARRQGWRLRVAFLASLILHALLGAGLATTGLGILSAPQGDDESVARNIFRPRLAADFPLEVSKTPAATPTHEKPLDLGLRGGEAASAAPAESPAARAIAPDRPREVAEEARVAVAVPARTAATDAAGPDAAAQLERAAIDGPGTERDAATPRAETVATLGQVANEAAPKPADAPRWQPADTAASTTPSAAVQPTEVALVPDARPRVVAVAPAEATDREAMPTPRAATLARRQAAAPAASAAARAEAIALEPADAEPTDSPQLRPSAEPAPRRQQASAATSVAGGAPGAEFAAAEASAVAVPAAALPTGMGSSRAASSSSASALPAGGPAALARAGLADTAGTGAAAGPVALPVDVPGAAAAGSAGVAAPGGTAPAPGPRPGARRTRESTTGGGVVSRGGSAGRASRADAGGGPPSAEDLDEGLSVSLGPESLAARGASPGSGRRSAGGDAGQPSPQVAALPRATAAVLPVEGRVREIAEPFAKRSRADRGPERIASMVDRGLEFLGRAQQPDGRWSLGAYPGSRADQAPKLASDTAATGLALLSFLGAGHDHFEGRHRDTVRRGLEFLLAAQQPDGDLYVPTDQLSNSCAWLYSHGIATMALCEAVGMTGDDIIRPAAARACGFIAASQHAGRGGWRYTPRSESDLSVSGWMLVALRSGQLARVPVEPRTLDGVRTLLDASALGAGSRNPLTRYHYNAASPNQRPAEISAACMTAVGTLMRLHTGWKKSDARVLDASRALAGLRPAYGPAERKLRDCYLWYYVSQVLVHTGGADWDAWYASLEETLAAHQETAGAAAGSWDPLGDTPDRWGPYGGRIYVTALHLLTLEVPYRHLPTYGVGD